MACGSWKVISDGVDELWKAFLDGVDELWKAFLDGVDELWKVFLDVEVERYDCVLESMAGASTVEGHRYDYKMV